MYIRRVRFILITTSLLLLGYNLQAIPLVNSLEAAQRTDATRMVDIYFNIRLKFNHGG